MRNEQGRMRLAVNRALDMSQGNSIRGQFAKMGGGSSDTKRPQAWCEYGYPTEVTSENLLQIWRRGGIGHGAVEKVIGNCWKTSPSVIEGGKENNATKETAFERDVGKLSSDVGMWNVFKKADRMRLVQRYSAIIISYADDKAWSEPVDKSGKKVIKKLRPVWATALQPGGTIDQDPASSNYGWPTFWQYTEVFADGATKGITDIHPDRIFFLGDMESDAVGWLEPAYNDLVSIEKLSGGGGESFLKNAARQVVFSFDPEVDFEDLAATYGVKVGELQKEFQKTAQALNRGIDTAIGLQGATVTPLQAAIADPGPIYNVNLQNVASALDIPTKILVGQQTGDRASTEDRNYFNSSCQSRREDLSPELVAFLRKIGAAGVLTLPSEITVSWDDLNESTASEKMELAFKMMDANSKAIDPASEPFTMSEVRTAGGYEPDKAAQ